MKSMKDFERVAALCGWYLDIIQWSKELHQISALGEHTATPIFNDRWVVAADLRIAIFGA